MLTFESSHLQFFGEYQAARVIYDLGVRHRNRNEPPAQGMKASRAAGDRTAV